MVAHKHPIYNPDAHFWNVGVHADRVPYTQILKKDCCFFLTKVLSQTGMPQLSAKRSEIYRMGN